MYNILGVLHIIYRHYIYKVINLLTWSVYYNTNVGNRLTLKYRVTKNNSLI